jgi:TRAP-type C4-dicarboxylate transport system permease small subunit
MNRLSNWLRRLRHAMEIVTTALFAAIFLIFMAAVFMRYVVQQPIAWADELNIVLLLWVMFLAGAFVLRDREHVAFDIVWSAAGPGARRAMGIAACLLAGGLFLWCLPGIHSYVAFLWRERTTVLEWRLDWVYSCFVLFIASVVLRFGAQLVRLLGRHWREEVKH